MSSASYLNPRIGIFIGWWLGLAGCGNVGQIDDRGAITGRVTSAQDSSPIANSQVGTVEGPTLKTALTDENGAFRLADLPGGEYTVSVLQAQGFQIASASKTLTLEEGQSAEVNFALSPEGQGTLAGTVLSSDHSTPVAAAVLNLSQNAATLASTTTGSDGRYQFLQLVPGAYQVAVASAQGYQVNGASASATVVADQSTTLDFFLTPTPIADPRPNLPDAPGVSAVDPKIQAYDLEEGVRRSSEHNIVAIDSILRKIRPAAKEPVPHRLALTALDELAHIAAPDALQDPWLKEFYRRRLELAAWEISQTHVTQGTVVWKLYGMGFVVRTASVTVALDLVRGYWAEVLGDSSANDLLNQIASQCDVLLVSNSGADHADNPVRDTFLGAGKPVAAAPSVWPGDNRIRRLTADGVTVNTIQLSSGQQLKALVFAGHQGANENNLAVVTTDEGVVLAHTGHQNAAGDLTWIDSIKNQTKIDLLLANDNAPELGRMIQGFAPKILITGHENELSEAATLRGAHFITYDRLQESAIPFVSMAWGESFFYTGQPAAASPTLLPSPVDPNHDWSADSDGFFERQHTWNLATVQQTLLENLPQLPEPATRKLAHMAIDQVCHYSSPLASINPAFSAHLLKCFEGAVAELEGTHPATGMRVWHFYNHGFVVRTPTVTLAFDLIRAYSNSELMQRVVNQSDVLFRSHPHSDHVDDAVAQMFTAAGKPIWGPASLNRDGQTRQPLQLASGQKLEVVIFPGHQGGDCDNNIFVIYTPEGLSVCHTGDQFFSNANPDDWDWLDVIKDSQDVNVLLINNWVPDLQRCVRGINPMLVIPGHENECGHAVADRKPWFFNYDRTAGMSYPTLSLSWGESYLFEKP